MFEQGFATLFRAVERIRGQLETADTDLRKHLTDELMCIQQLGERYIDYWMTLDEQIAELLETYLPPSKELSPTPTNQNMASPTADTFPLHVTTGTKSRTSDELHIGDSDVQNDWMDTAFDLSDPLTCAFRKGLAYYELFMYEDAAKSLEQVVASSNSVIGKLYLAASYAANEQFDAALHHVASVHRETREPLFLAAADELEALLHLQQGNPIRATECLHKVAQRVPRYPDVWFNLGVSYLYMNHYEEAVAALQNAVRLQSDDVESWRLIGHIELRRGRHDAALEACSRGLNLQPLNMELLHLLALIQRAQGKYEACIKTCRKVLKLHPEESQPWFLLAWVYAHTGQFDKAALVLKTRITVAPGDAGALLQLGIVYMLAGDYDTSERLLLKCFPSTAQKSLLWMALGQISLLRGNDQQAHTRYLRAMKDPRKPLRRLAMYSYGKLLMECNKYSDAETYLKAAALLGAPNSAIYEALSVCARQQGRAHEAEKLEQQAAVCDETS